MITPTHISSFSRYSALPLCRSGATVTNPASTAWYANNQAVYIPIWLPFYYDVKRVFWANGASVSGNVDVGIYAYPNNADLLFSAGVTAQAGTTALQYVTLPAAAALTPGFYFIALWASSTSGFFQFSTSITTNEGRAMGLRQELSLASGLPAVATMAQWAVTGYPICGITRTATGF